jgi:hypothetical protein
MEEIGNTISDRNAAAGTFRGETLNYNILRPENVPNSINI